MPEAKDGSLIMASDDVDVLVGWITKVVCDHVGIGEGGAPYVTVNWRDGIKAF